MDNKNYSEETLAMLSFVVVNDIIERLKKSNKEYAAMVKQKFDLNEEWNFRELFCEEPCNGIELSKDMYVALVEYMNLSEKCTKIEAMALYEQGHFDNDAYYQKLKSKRA